MSELTLVHSLVRWSSYLGLLKSVLIIHRFVASCKSQPRMFSNTKTLPTRPRVYLVFIPTVSYPNRSSFGYKNRYYTWTTHSPPSKDWVKKRSKKIKIKIVSEDQCKSDSWYLMAITKRASCSNTPPTRKSPWKSFCITT